MGQTTTGRTDGQKEPGEAPVPPEPPNSGGAPAINYVIVVDQAPATQRRVWRLLGVLVIICVGLAVVIWRELLKDFP